MKPLALMSFILTILISITTAATDEATEKAPACKVIIPANGTVDIIDITEVAIGEFVEYSCEKGYWRKGPKRRECIARGKRARLRGIMPRCRDRNECKRRRSCHKYAECTNTVGSYSCRCTEGYMGDGKICQEAMTTVRSWGCEVDGKFYAPGVEISSGKSGNWCFWQICNEDGTILYADDFNCGTTTTMHQTPPSTTTSSTTTIPTTMTTPPGCFHNGKHYAPGATISSGQSGNWCYSTICGDDGSILQADDFNCGSTPTPSTTPPTTIPPGCVYEGKHYPPGSTISSGQSGNWCYSTFCSDDGQIIAADDWNCGDDAHSTTSTTEPSTTLS